jgi:hypothetical protein
MEERMCQEFATNFIWPFQAVVWHCLVSRPALQRRQAKW